MPNTIPSPIMGMPVPVVSVDPGPDWATNINASLSILDSHDHTAGRGVQIPPAGLNINSDLTFQANNATNLRSVRLSINGAPLALPADLNCIYDSNGDLWFNDGSGNQVRLTQGGAIVGPSGTITGLPSGTASASYAAGTFTFQAATNTPAAMNIGPIVTGAEVLNSKTVTISASASQPSNYSLTWPLLAPSNGQTLSSDGSGNLTFTGGLLPIGSVIATFPNLAGAYTTSATTVADSLGFVLCQGQTIVDATSPMNGAVVPNISNDAFLKGSTTSGTTGGAATVTLSTGNLPSHTHTFTSGTSVATSGHTHGMVGHTHAMTHIHQWMHDENALSPVMNSLSPKNSAFVSRTTITGADSAAFTQYGVAAGGVNVPLYNVLGDYYTTGVVYAPTGTDGAGAATGASSPDTTATPSAVTTVSGTTDATGSGTAFGIVPPFFSAVYLMRVK